MKRIFLFTIAICNAVFCIGQISGPVEVNTNVTVTYINTNNLAGCDYNWEAAYGTIVYECDDSVNVYWEDDGYYLVELWKEIIAEDTIVFDDTIEVVAGDPPRIEFTYDASGNRTTREIVYYSINKSANRSIYGKAKSKEMEEEPSSQTILYPNPADNSIIIEVSSEVTESGDGRIYIYDVGGRQLKETLVYGTVNEVDISDLNKGTYIVKLFYGNKTKDWKLIKY